MILSCGEALIDCFKSTEDNSFDTIIGGSPLNVAVALQSSGTRAALLSNISTDQFGTMLVDHLHRHHVSTEFISRSDHLTGLMFVEYQADKSAIYNFYGHNTAEINFDIRSLNEDKLQQIVCLHFGSFSLVSGKTATSFAAIIDQQAQQRIISIDINVRTAIEPKLEIWRNKLDTLICQAHIFKASSEDLALLYDIENFDQTDAIRILSTWIKAGVMIAIITDADKGAYAIYEGSFIHICALNVNVIDTVGAGDCFMAYFLSTLEKLDLLAINHLKKVTQNQLKQAMQAGIKAAAYTVSHKGAVFPQNEE